MDDDSDKQTAARTAALKEAAEICRAFARMVLTEDGPSSDTPEHDAAMSCANLIESRAEVARGRAEMREAG